MIRQFLRKKFFALVKRDLAMFLEEHEEDLVLQFREEIKKMHGRVPDAGSYVDIRMVPLGEAILRASLEAIRNFLRGDSVAAHKESGDSGQS